MSGHDTLQRRPAEPNHAPTAGVAGPRQESLGHIASRLEAAPAVAQLRSTAGVLATRSVPVPVVQRYVILGREKSDVSKNILDIFAGETKKCLLYEHDVPIVVRMAIEAVADREGTGPVDRLTPERVSQVKGLAAHMQLNKAKIEAKLLQWVQSPGELQSTMIGTSAEAQWRHYDNVYELGLALAHETLPATEENAEREGHVADTVNQSRWIEARLREVLQLAKAHQSSMSLGRFVLDKFESFTTGSYNHADWVGKPGTVVKSMMGSQSTGEKITEYIKELHDMMERWSSSQAGSLAAKLHETVGISTILENPRNEAMEATVVDYERSDIGEAEHEPHVALKRDTRLNTEEDAMRAENEIARRRWKKMESQNMWDRQVTGFFKSEQQLLKTRDKRTEKLMSKYSTIADHDDTDLRGKPQHHKERVIDPEEPGVRNRGKGKEEAEPELEEPKIKIDTHSSIPEKNMLAKMAEEHFRKKREESDNAKRKQAEVGKINKTSKAKGRKNVGTRDEMDPDTLLSRLFSAPVWAGRSMTTARMMQMVEMLGGGAAHKTAVAHALFAYWKRTYNKGLTPIHTFHETMDVAHNFGVPYEPFHYPVPDRRGGDIDYMNPEVRPMTGSPGQGGQRRQPRHEQIEIVHQMPEKREASSGLRRVNQQSDPEDRDERPRPRHQAPVGKEKAD
ncbi:MAG: hypothetical protein V4574_01820 [Pseudomonadota bacterium]